jgi:predicted DNA binding protein
LEETLETLPDVVVEIERVAASEELLTPHFWVTNVSGEEFEAATEADPSVRDLRKLDSFEESTLYRAEWTENIDSIIHAYLRIGAIILDATGQHDCWEVQMRFDDQEALSRFQSYSEDNGVPLEVNRLHSVTQAHTAQQYGLTEKQSEALVMAAKAGYFESPAETTLDEVADDLGISQQALSQRIRQATDSLIASTLLTDSSPTA